MIMFPEQFIERIRTQKYIDADRLLNALQEASPVSIRINPSKWNRIPPDSEPVAWCSTGFYLKERPSFTLDPIFHSGCYYPQEASGMFLEQVFNQVMSPDTYIRVLDLCGAPGGKSTHLSSLIGSRGLLVSNEVIRTRVSVLSENIKKWGLNNTMVTRNDPSDFSRLEGFFNVILVDAPCSGEGMFRDNVAVNEWSVENEIHCSERQKRILTDVWPALKENGILIFSTCTFNPGENEANIKWLVSMHQAETIELDITEFSGIAEIDYQGIKGYGFYPGTIKGEGLFVSVIRKTGNSVKMSPGTRKREGQEPDRSDLEIVREWTTFYSDNIIRSGDEIYYVPGRMDDYRILKHYLRLISPGTRICTVKKNGYVPAHELAISAGLRMDAFPKAELDYSQAITYLRRDNIKPSDIPKGWFLSSYKGINLGFCNNIGNRVNNYFPVEWRIRMVPPKSDIKNVFRWDNENKA
jgi:16S rRNA C967 or C1407 C5-methylase (RsmB/RsmF family)/NOL1/NOP2/fmu family ribosome biogenesis protein